jgi:hypothetical protein
MTFHEPHHRSISTRLRLAHATEESTAAGVYGVIVSAAVMAASHAASAVALIVAVLVTPGRLLERRTLRGPRSTRNGGHAGGEPGMTAVPQVVPTVYPRSGLVLLLLVSVLIGAYTS